MEDCVFCDPLAPSSILYEDEVVMAFRDIHPRAAIHVLVIPKQHIKNTSELTRSHVALVEYMLRIGKNVLAQQCEVLLVESTPETHIFGFHQAPFNSVNHLHLHCIVPPFAHWWDRFKYSETSWISHFISAKSMIDQLVIYG
ncbi:hypothetical protein LEN26_014957 [Aphanomyces euteiches]|nr:hypothetical protein LEN26_014957 [Aphanomyces euteiches]KAH9128019.1 hypothetical protein AeMF1_001762 [Aphanomyces euteiches]KAH9186878.1 hypothetical protein AeNC1_011150 [Aphanomyces euteiches]